jgi:hypothetical protein
MHLYVSARRLKEGSEKAAEVLEEAMPEKFSNSNKKQKKIDEFLVSPHFEKESHFQFYFSLPKSPKPHTSCLFVWTARAIGFAMARAIRVDFKRRDVRQNGTK